MDVLKVENLSKTYRTGKKALENLNFNVEKGEILGFLGPNGAGKSTTISIIATLLKADTGSIVYFNNKKLNSKEIKRRLGIVPQDIALYENISAFDNVKFFAALYGIKKKLITEKVNSALDKVGLLSRANDKPATFSGGMKRRLNIACAIAHEPELIIFDEPTVGIDPQSRNHILESIKTLRANGSTIIYTTHYMEEVQQICDRIIIMDGGEVLLNDDLADVLHQFGGTNYQLTLSSTPDENALKYLKKVRGINEVQIQTGNKLNLRMKDTTSLPAVLDLVDQANLTLIDMAKREHNLEDIFLTLTGRKLRD